MSGQGSATGAGAHTSSARRVGAWLVVGALGAVGLVAIGSVILLVGFDQPLVLLVISACVGGLMMFIYSILLIQLNRKALPEPIKIRGVRLGVMGVSVLFFGVFSVLLVYDEGKALF